MLKLSGNVCTWFIIFFTNSFLSEIWFEYENSINYHVITKSCVLSKSIFWKKFSHIYLFSTLNLLNNTNYNLDPGCVLIKYSLSRCLYLFLLWLNRKNVNFSHIMFEAKPQQLFHVVSHLRIMYEWKRAFSIWLIYCLRGRNYGGMEQWFWCLHIRVVCILFACLWYWKRDVTQRRSFYYILTFTWVSMI